MSTPEADRPVRWGILGTGGIAAKFTTDLGLLGRSEAVAYAVGSRTQESADAFGEQFDIGRRHPSYASLVADPSVDVVYVSTPHPFHHENALLAINAGKHVLVEKPITLNATQARELQAAAAAQGVFLMEAMWTRFLPHVVEIRSLLDSGTLGELRTVSADHGQWFAEDPAHRIYAPELGGGALLDLGVYPVSFASMVLGPPSEILAISDAAFTGVDGQTSMLLRHPGGAHAVLTTTSGARSPNRAAIVGATARIEIDPVFYRPTSFSVIAADGVEVRHEHPHVGNGLRHQAREVGICIRQGLLESPVMPVDESIRIMATMDAVREQIGLVYPQERD